MPSLEVNVDGQAWYLLWEWAYHELVLNHGKDPWNHSTSPSDKGSLYSNETTNLSDHDDSYSVQGGQTRPRIYVFH